MRSHRLALLAALTAVATLVLAPSHAHAQLTVDELELHMAVQSSASVRTVRVRNDGGERVQATVTVEDWERDELGANRFMPSGTHAQSCAAGIEVFPASLSLEPGESANLRVALQAGATVPQNCWSIVFLENRATQAAGGRQLSYNVRTGIKVYGESPSARRDGLIDGMRLIASGGDSVSVSFRNDGDAQLLVHGAIEIRRADNSVVHRSTLDAFPVLPSQRRLIATALPALAKGQYIVLALLDFGGSELVAGQMEYEVR